jgi:hypothetical protein
MTWIDPANTSDWTERFQEVQAEFDAIKIDDVLSIQPGEIVEPHRINEELVKTARAFQQTGAVKDKARRLESIAKGWYEHEYQLALLETTRTDKAEILTSAELRKAYAAYKAEKLKEFWEAGKLLSLAVHDERQRLFQYREDLYNIGHNSRYNPDRI